MYTGEGTEDKETHGIQPISMHVAQMRHGHCRTAARLEDLGMLGWRLGERHRKRVDGVRDTHAQEGVAELLRGLSSGGDLTQVVCEDGAFARDDPGADVRV
jgi:hypothetical protein